MTDASTLAGELSAREAEIVIAANLGTNRPAVKIEPEECFPLAERGLMQRGPNLAVKWVDGKPEWLDQSLPAFYPTPLGLAVAKHLERDNG